MSTTTPPTQLSPAAPEYLLGHTEAELARLVMQARFYTHQTGILFRDAGLAPGMRVLDFGCGVGDGAFLAAEIVGESGLVVGIDRSPEAVTTARARAARAGLSRVSFHVADETSLEAIAERGPFDAVVGRLVLMYQRDPAGTVRRLAGHLKPGGVVAFHEVQLRNGSMAHPPSEVLTRLWAWLVGACGGARVELDMGFLMHRVLIDAGLVDPTVLLTARVEGGADSPAYDYLAETIRSLLPAIVKLGLATEEEVDVGSLAERLRAEVVAGRGVIVPSMMVGAHARRAL
jgi:ubiquinone/menaquinone biosynthesis C-methylase UbiE